MKENGGKPPRHPSDPVMRAAFARVLVEFRKEAKMKQKEVADKAGYEEKYIGALERRKHTPTLTALVEIATAMDVSPVEMVKKVCLLLPKFAHLRGRDFDSISLQNPKKT